jgi:hypothetical protein
MTYMLGEELNDGFPSEGSVVYATEYHGWFVTHLY